MPSLPVNKPSLKVSMLICAISHEFPSKAVSLIARQILGLDVSSTGFIKLEVVVVKVIDYCPSASILVIHLTTTFCDGAFASSGTNITSYSILGPHEPSYGNAANPNRDRNFIIIYN